MATKDLDMLGFSDQDLKAEDQFGIMPLDHNKGPMQEIDGPLPDLEYLEYITNMDQA